jgi:hypothetical protein
MKVGPILDALNRCQVAYLLFGGVSLSDAGSSWARLDANP